MEVLKEKKRQLETSDTKPKLVGHVELDKKGELLKIEAEPEELDEDTEGGGALKHRVTQSIAMIRDTKWKENIQKQELRWFALTGRKSTASASLGAPTEATVTTTETAAASSVGAEGMTLTAVTSTTEGDTVDLEVTMLNQGDDDDDVYGKKYRTTPEDRTDRSVKGLFVRECAEGSQCLRKTLCVCVCVCGEMYLLLVRGVSRSKTLIPLILSQSGWMLFITKINNYSPNAYRYRFKLFM